MERGEQVEVVVYSRPRCGFCVRLRIGLEQKRVPFREVNIWEDPDAAAAVRAVANGNETVPTVNVGDRWMVNPSAAAVLAALSPDSPAERRHDGGLRRLARVLGRPRWR
jgi:mycoredoxin